jgi:hypothetical protein
MDARVRAPLMMLMVDFDRLCNRCSWIPGRFL